MKNIIYIITLLLVVSCNTPKNDVTKNEIFNSDTTIITNDYPPLKNQVVLQIMEELKVCTSSDTVNLPPCSNEYFRIFKLGPKKPYDDGFILEMKAGLFGTPVKQTLIIKKGFNKYQIINQYLGFLIETRTSSSGFNDLLMGYYDTEIGVIAIKHTFDGNKYQPIEVEEINGYFIKEAVKDSINHLFIDNFNAGY